MIGYCKKYKMIALSEAECYYCRDGNQGGKVDRYICLEFTEDIPDGAYQKMDEDFHDDVPYDELEEIEDGYDF